MQHLIEPIGFCQSPYHQKFSIPRQPQLAPSAKGKVILVPPYNNPDMVAGLQAFSHLWLLFLFDQHLDSGWQPKVRPPRLGGDKKLGVLATRSTFRPNAIGQSVVQLDRVVIENNQVELEISGMDLLNQTPVIDIKPYLPYADAIVGATAGFASTPPALKNVSFSQHAAEQLDQLSASEKHAIQALICEVLAQDPRPAYRHKMAHDPKIYKVQLAHYDVHFQIMAHQVEVKTVQSLGASD